MSTRSHSAEIRHPRRHQPEARRNAILQAALVEFAREGLAGARVDAIAEAAGVNKALLYYYFGDKEALYGAILDRFFETLAERVMKVCNRPGTAGERFLWYARTHFDSIAESPYYAHIFMSELMSASRDGSPHLDRIFANYMRPIAACVMGLVQEGVRNCEFRPVDPNQFLPSAIGSIVHYFLTAPLRQKFFPELYLPAAKAVEERRAAVLDFIAAALFADREKGLELAADIAAQPAATLASETVVQQKPRDRRAATSPRSAPAPEKDAASTRAPGHDSSNHSGPTESAPRRGFKGYQWMDRWFPDFETAARVLQEERKRHPRTAKRKRPNPSGDDGELK